jgi:hypothetical protein
MWAVGRKENLQTDKYKSQYTGLLMESNADYAEFVD